ncbi:MAG: hypothetical protein ACLPPV_05160, partial [Candidatus Korobacteraceae bacterium]
VRIPSLKTLSDWAQIPNPQRSMSEIAMFQPLDGWLKIRVWCLQNPAMTITLARDRHHFPLGRFFQFPVVNQHTFRTAG